MELITNVKERERMTMRDYAKMLRPGQQVELTLLAIFPPARYPSFTLSFRDPDGILIRRSLPANEHNKELIRSLWKKAQEARGRLTFVAIFDGDQLKVTLEGERDPGAYQYVKSPRGGLILRRAEALEEGTDDIPF